MQLVRNDDDAKYEIEEQDPLGRRKSVRKEPRTYIFKNEIEVRYVYGLYHSSQAQDKNSKLVELELFPKSSRTVRLANCLNTLLVCRSEY
jgi:hypothetical protein